MMSLSIAMLMNEMIFNGITIIVKSIPEKIGASIKSGNRKNTIPEEAERKKSITPIIVIPTLFYPSMRIQFHL
jgi:hypothetical protein